MEWVLASKELPPIDESDKWNKKTSTSKDVLTYSKEFGLRFGRYNHFIKEWSLNNITSNKPLKVKHWMEIITPYQKQKAHAKV